MRKKRKRKKSKNQHWRRSREWRVCKIVVKRRDKRCLVCNSLKHRHVHHVKSASYFPDLRTDPDNCIVLCKTCHLTMLHIMYKGGYRKKATEKDLYKFMVIARHYIKVGEKKEKESR